MTASDPIEKILILGAGWSGRQIAAQMVAFGKQVVLYDVSEEVAQQSPQAILSMLESRIAEGIWPAECLKGAPQRVHWTSSGHLRDSKPDLVLESVSEQISIKRRAIKEASDLFPAPTIIASNSSYFVPSLLSKYVTDASRYAHFHFHVPVWLSTIVDVCPGPQTNSCILERLSNLARDIGQTPIIQTVENPGYIFNWMLQALLRSSLELVDRKVATPEQIELAWTTISGMKIGPIKMMDQIGLDVIHQVLCNARWSNDEPNSEALIDLLQPMIDAGDFGVKSGKGFFEYRLE